MVKPAFCGHLVTSRWKQELNLQSLAARKPGLG
jgi:hypothetical protein